MTYTVESVGHHDEAFARGSTGLDGVVGQIVGEGVGPVEQFMTELLVYFGDQGE